MSTYPTPDGRPLVVYELQFILEESETVTVFNVLKSSLNLLTKHRNRIVAITNGKRKGHPLLLPVDLWFISRG